MPGPLVLTVNAGSSSIRLAVLEGGAGGGARLPSRAAAHEGPLDEAPARRLLDDVLRRAGGPVLAAAHRIVHGGARFREPLRLDGTTLRAIEDLVPLAPLHLPANLAWVRRVSEALGPGAVQVGVFDTAFHADLPPEAATYALPRSLRVEHGIRRYGFHGLAHRSMLRRLTEVDPERARGRVLTLQLGSGCSATAIREGRSVDTSMGFSPLEGLVMGTRPGDLDPGILPYLVRAVGLAPAEVEDLIERHAGLLGLSGETSDMSRLLESGRPEADLAIGVFSHRLRRYVGAFTAVLGGLDAIVFGGGIGENAPEIRSRALAGLEALSIRLDPGANAAARGREGRISPDHAKVAVWVVLVDEASELAREALHVLGA